MPARLDWPGGPSTQVLGTAASTLGVGKPRGEKERVPASSVRCGGDRSPWCRLGWEVSTRSPQQEAAMVWAPYHGQASADPCLLEMPSRTCSGTGGSSAVAPNQLGGR